MDTVLIVVDVVLQLVMIALGLYLGHLFRSIIVPVFQTDPDVSLRSILQSLETAATTASKVNKDLDVNVAEARQQFSRLVVLLDHLQKSADAAAASSERIEAEDAKVAERLRDSQDAARRAGQPPAPPGSAGDTAARGPGE